MFENVYTFGFTVVVFYENLLNDRVSLTPIVVWLSTEWYKINRPRNN